MPIARRLTHALILVLTLMIGATAAAVIVSQTAWFKNWVRAYIVREAGLYLNGTLTIERLSGNVLFGLEMENVDVSMDGQHVVAIKDMGLDYNIWDFVTKGLSVDNLRLDKPVIYLRRQGDTWTLSRLIKKQEGEANRRGPERPVTIADIGITDGSFVIDDPVGTSGIDVPKRFDHVDAKLAFKYEPVHYSIDVTHVSFRASEPALALNALSGSVSVRDDEVYFDKLAIRTAETSLLVDGAVREYLSRPMFNLQISSDKLSVKELARLFPALSGVQLQPQFDATLNGPADRLGVVLNVVASAGRVHADVVANVKASVPSVTGSVSVRHLDLAPVLNDPRRQSDITGDAQVDLRASSPSDPRSIRGTVAFDAPRIAAEGYAVERAHGVVRLEGTALGIDARGVAYGSSATAKGRVTLPQGNEAVRYDLRGRARHVDLRQMPATVNVPRAATDVTAEYHVVGSSSGAANLDLRFAPSTVAGTRIAEGGTATLALGGEPIEYKADVTVSDLDVQQVAKAFQIQEFSTDRYATAIDGHIVASGRGGSAGDLHLTASGTLNKSGLFGGRVENIAFEAGVADGTAHVKAAGPFVGVDPAALLNRSELNGRISGRLDVDVTIARVSDGLTPENVEGSGVANLEPSSIGGLDITRATVDASYHHSVADIRSLNVDSPDLHAQASGTLALNETGSSNLTVQADSPNLEALSKIVNRPLSGIANVNATVTGNKQRLEAKGHFVGDGVKYGDNGALTVAADFTAQVPGLSIADGAVSADGHATFVTIAGQNVNEVSGHVDYHQEQLAFDLTAKEPQRSLGAAGSMVIHPDHHEVHLQKVALETAGQTWQLAPGASPTLNYAQGDVKVSDLKLVNGDQSVEASGTYGRAGDALHVTASNVDVANIDALLLRPAQLSGRLNGTATVRQAGEEARAPNVDADFQVANGAFRQFRYTAFGGTVRYSGKGMTVDTKLEQSPTTFITAKGYVPTALFSRVTAGEREAAHDSAADAAERIDLHIESTPIDLGLIQGLTTELTNVTGTMQANIDVTGSAADPHPSGLVTFQKGGFTVESTGVTYNTVEGKIELQPDRVHVGAISALDNHFNPITISGDLAVHEHQVGDVKIYIHTDDFKVIDNQLGNLRVNTDLQIEGELRAPRVTGDMGVTTGTVDLDRVLAGLGESAYATVPTEYGPQLPEVPGKAAETLDLTHALSALSMDVHLTVPDDLIVKAADLQAPGSPVGLGSVTVTLGGDLRATKTPNNEVSLLGTVNTVRGIYMFQGRRFEIQRDGYVRFTGEPLSETDPTLDIAASRTVQAVETHVNVRGRLRDPQFVLSSIPPLPEADILALILFNQPANMLGETQQFSLLQQAQYLAGSSLTTALSQSIATALHLDEFDINLAPESGHGPQVRIGQQIGTNLYVKVEQGIGDQSQTNFVLEYELQRWLRLRTNILQGSAIQPQLFQRLQGSGIDLLFFFSY